MDTNEDFLISAITDEKLQNLTFNDLPEILDAFSLTEYKETVERVIFHINQYTSQAGNNSSSIRIGILSSKFKKDIDFPDLNENVQEIYKLLGKNSAQFWTYVIRFASETDEA